MRQTGSVLNFNLRGYGFIQPDGSRCQVYFHITQVAGRLTLREGDRVSFETEQHDKGDRAVKVQLLDLAVQS